MQLKVNFLDSTAFDSNPDLHNLSRRSAFDSNPDLHNLSRRS